MLDNEQTIQLVHAVAELGEEMKNLHREDTRYLRS
jgi:hypothetical protein